MILKRNKSKNIPHKLLRSWKEHYEQYMNPSLLTRLLRKAVPALEAVAWRVESVEEGGAQTILPLLEASTNQHGTHQAALIGLSADYTGGIALASVLNGVPFAGIHPCDKQNSASLWLADMSVRFLSPSTGHMRGICNISDDLIDRIRGRYFSGKKVFVSLPVEFRSNDELVAQAEMKYFVQPSIQLEIDEQGTAISPIVATKIKASARMIAGVRAQSPNFESIRIDCPHTQLAATEHGELLAEKLRSALPQLTDMVHARTQHGDNAIRQINGLRQVVLLGSGLDMRPYRLHHALPDVTWFEMDLPVMLEERQRIVSQLSKPPAVRRRPMALDLLHDDFARKLREHPDFDLKLPTMVVFEGCSMYFSEENNRRILSNASSLLHHPASRFWCDMVTSEVVAGNSGYTEVEAFLAGMDELGEQFVFGHDQPKDLVNQCGFETCTVTTSSNFLGIQDRLFDMYRFVIAK
ncbi:MAG: SAM-dependent methyltransferase [Planctomycetota bacterium]